MALIAFSGAQAGRWRRVTERKEMVALIGTGTVG